MIWGRKSSPSFARARSGALCAALGLTIAAWGCASTGGGGGSLAGIGEACSANAGCESGRCVAGLCERPMVRDAGAMSRPDCVDTDGDGRGDNCAAGPDCDDHDPAVGGGIEGCDAQDNDCDGLVDEGDSPLCSVCDLGCEALARGVASDAPFTPGVDPAEGVKLDEEGALVLDSRGVNSHIIWVANTGEGTVSKVDTTTFLELARYRTGPSGSGDDPSRTSVNTLGDVYVGNRGGFSVTKISLLGAECPDTNGDGVVRTSTGPFDVLAWGQDDCVLWRRDLRDESLPTDDNLIRAVAAQDVLGPDGELAPFVWIGAWIGVVWKLDGETGEILLRTDSPTRNYGFALDGAGNLWTSGRSSNAIGRIDTLRCVSNETCAAPICGDDGDACVKQKITTPAVVGGEHYGITVDSQQRVWDAYYNGYVTRYDPRAPLGSRFVTVKPGDVMRGIAADAHGFVWVGAMAQGVVRLSADDPTQFVVVPGTEGYSPIGVAVDQDGKVWAINHGHNHATVITPGAGLSEASVAVGAASGFVTPYTYSDMTGSQLRLVTNPRGSYRAVFMGCDSGATSWNELFLDAETPVGTRVLVRVRTGDDRAALDAASFGLLFEVPADAAMASLRDYFTTGALGHGKLLEIEIQLHSTRTSGTSSITPRVRAVHLTRDCPMQLE